MALAKDLKKDMKITLDNETLIVEKIEVSKIGKHGKSKCRLECLNDKNEKKIFIVLSDDEIQVHKP